jgi:hypothetical protein
MSNSGRPKASARSRVCCDTTTELARVRLAIFSANSAVEFTSRGTTIAPVRSAANIAIPYSGRLTPNVMTRSPLRTPSSLR